MDEQVLDNLYTWIDQVPLTRPKRDIKRDFSDGVLVAEIVKFYRPHLVELHNYVPALAASKKTVNWHILNRKVFKKLGFEVNDDVIQNIVSCKQWSVEQFLLLLRKKIESSATGQKLSPTGGGDRHDNGLDTSVPGSVPLTPTSPQDHRANVSTVPKLKAKPAVARYVVAADNLGQQPMSSSDQLVPTELLNEKMQELLAKDETIQILQEKICRLEHLLQLKDIRIQDLQMRLSQVEISESSKPVRSQPGKTSVGHK